MSRGQAAKKRPAASSSKGPAKGLAKGTKGQEKSMAASKATATKATAGKAAASKAAPPVKAPPAPKAAAASAPNKAAEIKAKAKEPATAAAAPATAEKDAPEGPESPLPLLDLTDAAVKKMIKQAKKRGYVTHEQLNAVLPSEEVSSDQIEDIYAMLNEMGINVVEQEEGADETRRKKTTMTTATASSSRSSRRRSPPPRRKSRPSAPTIRSACICVRWARSSFSPAKAKSRLPSASRPAARR